jgi:hypothetical protein
MTNTLARSSLRHVGAMANYPPEVTSKIEGGFDDMDVQLISVLDQPNCQSCSRMKLSLVVPTR